MKIVFQFASTKELHEEEIDPNASIEQVRDMLKSKYTLPDGNVFFIHGGSFLRNPQPFSKLKERAKIVIYVKKIVPKPAEETNQEIAEAPRQNTTTRPPTDEEMIQHFTPILENIIQMTFLENAYNPEYVFWNCPREVYEISQLLNNHTVSFSILQDFVSSHYPFILEVFKIPQTFFFDIIGFKYQTITNVISDLEADLQQLSNAQYSSYQRLLKLGLDKQLTYNKFKECGFNEEQARACLSQLRK